MASQLITTGLRAAPVIVGGAIAVPEVVTVMAVAGIIVGGWMIISSVTGTKFKAKKSGSDFEFEMGPAAPAL